MRGSQEGSDGGRSRGTHHAVMAAEATSCCALGDLLLLLHECRAMWAIMCTVSGPASPTRATRAHGSIPGEASSLHTHTKGKERKKATSSLRT